MPREYFYKGGQFCDPESSFFNAVSGDINDLRERLLTLLLMKLNDGIYASGRDFNQLLHDFKIINYNLLSHVFRLTHVSQSKIPIVAQRLQRTRSKFIFTACVRDDQRVRKKKLNLFSICNSIIILFWHAALLCLLAKYYEHCERRRRSIREHQLKCRNKRRTYNRELFCNL